MMVVLVWRVWWCWCGWCRCGGCGGVGVSVGVVVGGVCVSVYVCAPIHPQMVLCTGYKYKNKGFKNKGYKHKGYKYKGPKYKVTTSLRRTVMHCPTARPRHYLCVYVCMYVCIY